MPSEVWPANVLPVGATVSLKRSAPLSAVAATVSPRVTLRPGSLWMMQLTFQLLDAPRWGQITALLDRVSDRAGSILVPAFDRYRPATWEVDAPPAPASAEMNEVTLKGATFVRIKGLTPNSRQLGPGDRLSINERLYRVSNAAPVTANSEGVATLNIAPPMREDALTGDVVLLTRPVCRMRCTSPLPIDIPVVKPSRGAVTLTFSEADIPAGGDEFARTLNLYDFLANTVMPDEIGADA